MFSDYIQHKVDTMEIDDSTGNEIIAYVSLLLINP